MNANDTASLSNFGFLYGTFPSAPGVFVYANQYDVAVQMVTNKWDDSYDVFLDLLWVD